MTVFAALAALASHAQIPNVFKSNEPARAGEVNQNFNYLDTRLDSAVKHTTIETGSVSFDRPPIGSRFATIKTGTGAPFVAQPNWYNLISLRHRNGVGLGVGYGGQIAWGMANAQDRIAFRSQSDATWSPWVEFFTKANLTAANLPGGPYIKESTALYVDSSQVVHVSALQVHTSIKIPDYVFAPDYKLSPLAEVEAYTQENQHLPDVPSAAEIEKGGLDLAKMNLALLRKVEELTLHAISQEKRIQSLETEIKTLR